MPQSSALPLPPPHLQSTDIFSSLPLHQSAIHPTFLAANSGMLQTPYASSQSLSSCEDSPSPRTPAISDSASSSSPRTTPSPNIQLLTLSAPTNGHGSDINNASSDEQYSPEPKQATIAPIRHPEVVLTMQQPGQHNLPQEQPPPNSGKGGCWTCRIRRKKCDEQRTGDSCQTCIRLRIDCLGWGPKRPVWMRDKQAVEVYKAGIKEKLIKAGMVRGQPRLPREGTSRSSTLPSGPSIPSDPPAQLQQYNHQHPASRSMSGPAAFGGLGGMGSIGPMGAFGVMGGSMSGGGMGYDYGQQQYTQQHLQPHQQSVRYGPYPSPRTLQGFSSPHLASQIPQESAVMGSDFDYLGFPEHGENEPQPQHSSRRASMGMMPSHHQTAQHLENRRRSLVYSSSSSVAGGSPSHGNSPYISGHNPLGGPYANAVSSQTTHSRLTDFPGDVFGNLGSSGGVANASPAISGLTVPGMNTINGVPIVSGSPSMIPADESMLFPGGGMYVPSRPSSSLASATTPSRSNSSPNAGYNDPLTDPSLLDPHVQYYFDSVMPMQYAFASERARGILQNLFAREPFGPLVNASCALAAKHNKTIRVARLLDPPDADPQQSTAQQFFDRAYWQLANTTAREGYTASGALASLHLVAYFLLQGGSGAWQVHLDTARAWLAQTGLCAPENEAPKDTLALMGDAEQLAAKMTTWYDVFAAISQHQSPRFLTTYQRLFGNTIERGSADHSLRVTDMGQFMGCPEDVLLILAETAALSHWKAQEHQLGTLSSHELLRRGVAIEERLLVSTVAEETQYMPSAIYGAAPATSSQMHPTRPSGEHSVPSPAQSAVKGSTVGAVVDATGAAHSSVALTTGPSYDTQPVFGSEEPAAASMGVPGPSSVFGASNVGNAPVRKYSFDAYQRVTRVFLRVASLYLASVTNEPSPNIPEISNAVDAIVNELRQLHDFAVDRMLALPLLLVGCLTDHPEHRQFVLSRLCALDDCIGNMRSVRLLMDRVWAIRDAHGGAVDWREVMRNDFSVEILFV